MRKEKRCINEGKIPTHSQRRKIVKITKRFLQQEEACLEGIDWVVKNCKGEDGIEVVKKLMDYRLDWANWLIVRIMADWDNNKD